MLTGEVARWRELQHATSPLRASAMPAAAPLPASPESGGHSAPPPRHRTLLPPGTSPVKPPTRGSCPPPDPPAGRPLSPPHHPSARATALLPAPRPELPFLPHEPPSFPD